MTKHGEIGHAGSHTILRGAKAVEKPQCLQQAEEAVEKPLDPLDPLDPIAAFQVFLVWKPTGSQ